MNIFSAGFRNPVKMWILTVEGDKKLLQELNSELFEWVIENLIKNALDAIDHKEGKITIDVLDMKK